MSTFIELRRRAGRHAPLARPAAAAVLAVALAAGAGCVPASQYHEPRPAFAGAEAPGVDATAAALAGTWTGQYDAPFYARRGALRLSLRPVARVVDGAPTRTVAGTATFSDGSAGAPASGAPAPAPVAVDSARVERGRVVLFLAPYADQESGATVRLRLDGALAADTLGGRLSGHAAATVAAERHGGWRLVRVASATAAARAP